MDGVLVDFDSTFQKHMPGHTEDTDWTWEELHSKCPRIYEIADPMSDMYDLRNFLLSWYSDHVHILTAIPKRWSWPDVTKHKRSWINYYLNWIPNNRICFGPYAEDKQFHCTGPQDILIDDKLRNIEQWKSRGGTGILHVCAADTINRLKEYLQI